MNNLSLLAKHFYNLGLNVTCITNQLTEYSFYATDLLKAPNHEWLSLNSRRQTSEEFENLDWKNATGLGTVAGFRKLHVLDIDGCSDDDFLLDILAILGLPKYYEWVVRSGSQNGYHVFFYSEKYSDLEEEEVCSSFRVNKANNSLLEKMELLWGTHVVLPPSMHKSGGKYAFVNTRYPKNRPLHIDISRFNVIINLFLDRSSIVKKRNYQGKLIDTLNLQSSDHEPRDLMKLERNLFLVYDIKTSGEHKEGFMPSIFQVSWMVMDYSGIVHKRSTEIIKNKENILYSKSKNGLLTKEVIEKLGVSSYDAFKRFLEDLRYCDQVVAHDLQSTLALLSFHISKAGIRFNFKEKMLFCTKTWALKYFKRMGLIIPEEMSLISLYEGVFSQKLRHQKNAISDVIILAKVVKEIMFMVKKA